MNALGLHLVWTALQVSLYCLSGALLYGIARRRNPASGAWAAGAVLALVVAISALAASPWPRWWTPTATVARRMAADSADERQASTDANDERLAPGLMAEPIGPRDRRGAFDSAVDPPPVEPSTWRTVFGRVRAELASAGESASVSAWRWPAWLAIVLLAGCGIALARLSIAVVVARRHASLAQTIDDAGMIAMLDDIRQSLGIRRVIELRETPRACSPSTIGWLRPAIVLPRDWRDWIAPQRRAVLAHEAAHVARGDFAVGLLAQLSVALHFYNPLVHWLAARLRLEQELAADVCGARLAGGRQGYLATLAEMSLRTTDVPLAWAARPFLPTRGTLMRRIDVLHREKILPDPTVSRSRRATLALVLLIFAALVAGVRAPTSRPLAAAAQPAAAGEADAVSRPFDLDFVPNDAMMVLALRPAELIQFKSLATLKDAITQTGMLDQLDLPLGNLAEFKFASGVEGEPTRPYAVIVLRSRNPHDWKKLGNYFIGENDEVTENGHTYFKSKTALPGQSRAYWLPDERTIVLSIGDAVSKSFARGGANGPGWADAWKSIAQSPAALVITTDSLKQEIHREGGRVDAETFRGVVGPLLFSGNAREGGLFTIEGRAPCESVAAAEEFKLSLTYQLGTLKRAMYEHLGRPNQLGSAPSAEAMLRLLDATDLEVRGSTVHSRTTVSQAIGRSIAASVVPARAAARRALSVNKLRQIGIALHNYHDVHKHFPPAVIMGPDGKTPHSWRVALLPYLDKPGLYEQYRLDEPWDSEHNRSLVAAGAELFSVPSETPSDDCGYFALVGPGTAFDPDKTPLGVRNIVDGTSKTVAIVEAKRSIPWTTPEDVVYDPDGPLPKLGGFFTGGFDVLFLDAHVSFLPDDVDERLLRALISYSGRESTTVDPKTGLDTLGKPR